MRKCPFCTGSIQSSEEPCIFCDGVGCSLCANSNGMTAIVWCDNGDCILGDVEDTEYVLDELLSQITEDNRHEAVGEDEDSTIDYIQRSYE